MKGNRLGTQIQVAQRFASLTATLLLNEFQRRPPLPCGPGETPFPARNGIAQDATRFFNARSSPSVVAMSSCHRHAFTKAML